MKPGDALTGAVAIAALNVAFSLYSTVRGLRALIRPPRQVEPRDHWPKVSLIVPACNEADTIEAATRAKLQSDYPELEIVLVDDRSTDGTGEILDRLAATDSRVRVVHLTELPSGWLGKVHALSRGCQQASGDYFLFCDADVHIDADFLRRCMVEVTARKLEFVTALPEILPSSFALDVVLATFVRLLVVGGRLWLVGDPTSRAAVGGGVFGMVERRAFERTPGFEWLRLEIADDVALGQMMKRHGARSAVLDGCDGVRLHFYRSFGEMMRGLEKNGYAVFGGLRPLRLAAMVTVMLGLELVPLIALAAGTPLQRVAGGVMVGLLALCQVLVARTGRRDLSSALVPAVGVLALVVFAIRSAILVHARGGVVWRGTLYPLAELRAGRRLEFF
ncbi:MAG: glycosyltransferase [Polyangiaceae bacterium]|nr:glycosyltransferase [Polyangiaceae bacterium]